MNPVRLGITGITGYAQIIADQVLALHDAGCPLHLVAVTDPDMHQDPQRLEQLAQQGVQTVDSYEKLLARADIDAVWLPLPINLHAPFAIAALEAGKAVMCEKPAAATVDQLDRMIQARDAANRAAAIGFNSIYEPSTLKIKRLLRRGILGDIQRVAVLGCWPRNQAYYQRSDWPGRIRRRGQWVLDSPAHNAMAHFINLPLFLLGATDQQSANPLSVDAELYRANPIENYDTCCLRYQLDAPSTPTMLVCMTHACSQQLDINITVYGQRGRLVWTADTGGRFLFNDGSEQTFAPLQNRYRDITLRFAQLVRNVDSPDIAYASLEVARAHVVAVNGASEAAEIVAVPNDIVQNHTFNGAPLRVIPGIEAAFKHCLEKDLLLHESGQVDWSTPARSFDLHDYRHFTGAHLLQTN